MKYIAILIIPFFIMSCALEKEESDYVNGVFTLTIASVKIDNINDASQPLCIDYNSGDIIIDYSIISDGIHDNPNDTWIKDSYLEINIVTFYFGDYPINISPTNNKISYNNGYKSVQEKATLTKEDFLNIPDGIYKFEIGIVASEFYGDGKGRGSQNETLYSPSIQVQISSTGQGCQ